MNKLRCRPGDLAIVTKAQFPTNLGRIVRVISIDERKGDLIFPQWIPTWIVRCELPMTWRRQNKRYRRKKGPVPDAYLQPIRGNAMGKDVTDESSSDTILKKLPMNIKLAETEKLCLLNTTEIGCDVRMLKMRQFEAALKKVFEGGADLSGRETP